MRLRGDRWSTDSLASEVGPGRSVAILIVVFHAQLLRT